MSLVLIGEMYPTLDEAGMDEEMVWKLMHLELPFESPLEGLDLEEFGLPGRAEAPVGTETLGGDEPLARPVPVGLAGNLTSPERCLLEPLRRCRR